VLTEAEVERSFRRLMRKRFEDPQAFQKMEQLLENHLRPESPLRRRLMDELRQVRKLQETKN
jgi:division protein CdvB (Snf7/Vps24/ESCRT-III family)